MIKTEEQLRTLIAAWPTPDFRVEQGDDGRYIARAIGTRPPLRGSTTIASGRGKTYAGAVASCLAALRKVALDEAESLTRRAANLRIDATRAEERAAMLRSKGGAW